jgi:hypothetical protein
MGATAINGEPNQGSYDKRSPREVLLNRRMDARIDARIKTGAYVQVTVRNTDNTMKARTLDAIALEPMRNTKGTYRFFLLDTKRVITADHWKELPIPDSVIKRLNEMADEDYGVGKEVSEIEIVRGNQKVMDDSQGALGAEEVHVPQPPENNGYITNEMLENRLREDDVVNEESPAISIGGQDSNAAISGGAEGADEQQQVVDAEKEYNLDYESSQQADEVNEEVNDPVNNLYDNHDVIEEVITKKGVSKEQSVPVYEVRHNKYNRLDYKSLHNSGTKLQKDIITEQINFIKYYGYHLTIKEAKRKFGEDMTAQSG